MSSMVKSSLPFALLIFASLSMPALAEPVVQALPRGYQPAGPLAPAGSTPAPQPAAPPMVVPMVGGGGEWDAARAAARQGRSGEMASAIERWKMLSRTDAADFSSYSGFILSYPGFPSEEKLRRYAEKALDRESIDSARLVAFFDRKPPLTNSALARYALALSAIGRSEARANGLSAWRGGAMGDASEAALGGWLADKLSPADQDARMDALL
ncbi:MAG: lytic transglycosylase domain-containing protein, partial [Novosphingobium sp.]